MEFLLLVTDATGAPAPEPAGMAAMGRYVRELADRAVLRRGAPLASESAGACARVHARWDPVQLREVLFFDRV
jgi:hypothetical protein